MNRRGFIKDEPVVSDGHGAGDAVWFFVEHLDDDLSIIRNSRLGHQRAMTLMLRRPGADDIAAVSRRMREAQTTVDEAWAWLSKWERRHEHQ